VIEQFLENLPNDQLSRLNYFALMAVEPIFIEPLLLRNLKRVLVIPLQISDDGADGGKPQMQQFFHVEVFHLDNILRIFFERSRADLLSPQHADIHHLGSLFGNCLQLLVDLFRPFSVDLVRTGGEGGEAIRMDCYHISVNFVVLLSTHEKVLCH
jgi:hypothetical protein